MVLPTGESPVSFSQIRDEFGTAGTDSATAPVRLGQYRRDDPSFTNKDVGELTGLPLDDGIPTSGTINIDAFHGKKLNTVVDLHETGSSTYNHNVKTDRFDNGQYDFVGGYRDSLSASTWQGGKKMIVHVNKTFSSTGATNQNDVALTIGDSWPGNTEFQIDLGSSAVIAGKGGDGGNGGAGTDEGGSTGAAGGNGTSALALETGMTINSQAAGAQIIAGGGGGGGGAGASQDDTFLGIGDRDEGGGGGGGGGVGLPAGDPGSGGSGGGATSGGEGTLSAGGNGGIGGDDDESEGRDGGVGGDAGEAGIEGGVNGSNGKNVDGGDGLGGAGGSEIIYF